MTLAPKLQLRQAQTLALTPQLRQSIALLQFSTLDAAAFVEGELERNPLLERVDGHETHARDQVSDRAAIRQLYPSPLPTPRSRTLPVAASGHRPVVADGPGLLHRLASQLRLSRLPRAEQRIGEALIAALSATGRIDIPADTMASSLGTSADAVESVRRHMMRFDPVGVFARDLRECLAVQLEERGQLDEPMTRLVDHLPLVARRDVRRLARACDVAPGRVVTMIALVRALNPTPGRGVDEAGVPAVVPELMVSRGPGGRWVVERDDRVLPRIALNAALRARAGRRVTGDDRRFLRRHAGQGAWLIRALEQRGTTMLNVAEDIMSRQIGFLEHGPGGLVPLTMRTLAQSQGLHESTISRVSNGKYIATPHGTFELRYFFTQSVGTVDASHSAEAVRRTIARLIDAERADAILSDADIAEALCKLGMDIARRTVAKYRDALNIPGSVQRRRNREAGLQHR
ncbi:RNA polymerase sigma-24 factor [Ameyamaea chiangmaiensis NBRC 103196]|nr:RNA polymerase factor sigma-54 [Ameyamaea chiangmaiensis]MBS4073907.1 RNA polymerase factor sigma-54 [Ameyamaea chiangmaiensis]GBQ67982.1 RNA polymerase sigma-24 factor [Ameyamaea chiangmaiensis NBRC 103196]